VSTTQRDGRQDGEVRSRARPMSPDERRAALVDATLDLLREHGRGITTRQIAEAAGVAEGTIFRVFDSKEELVDAAISRAFEPGALVDRIAEIDLYAPLRDRLLALTSIMQQRFRATFVLMQKVGMVRPPDDVHDRPDAVAWRERLVTLVVDLIGKDAAAFRVPPQEFFRRLRLLTFAGSHPHISDGHVLTPDEIVDTLLDGLRATDARRN
jgi:AcrR family transcriptional regulator